MRYTIGLREVNQQLAKHIKAVEEGHDVIITRRGRAIARITADLGEPSAADARRQEAYQRMLRLMDSAPRVDGVLKWARDELYER